MKKKILWMLFAMILCVNISSCSKDDDDDKASSVQTGTLVITNGTSDTYNVNVDGDSNISGPLASGIVRQISYMSVGLHTIYAEQMTGYALYPTKLTYTAKIEAGQTTYIVIKN